MVYLIISSLAIHCAFYIIIFRSLARYQNQSQSNIKPEKKASIIICYHNEESNVDHHLPMFLNQKVDQVLLVDDYSTDDTLARLKAYESEWVKVLSIKKNSSGKKLALSKGIQAAKNNNILLTDADCWPASQHWAAHMCKISSPFVLGYGPMRKVKGIVGLFSRYETYITALQYLSYALKGMPYMGVGRNLKINKSLVLRNKHKIKGSILASGDDDLMINALANRQNTSICIHPESFVYSTPKTTLKAFLYQKTRHISASGYYKSTHKLLLGLFSGSQILFYAGLILALIAGTISFKLALLLLLVKWSIQQTINYPVMKKLKESDMFWKIPFLDILFFIYLLILPVFYLFNKNNSRWI